MMMGRNWGVPERHDRPPKNALLHICSIWICPSQWHFGQAGRLVMRSTVANPVATARPDPHLPQVLVWGMDGLPCFWASPNDPKWFCFTPKLISRFCSCPRTQAGWCSSSLLTFTITPLPGHSGLQTLKLLGIIHSSKIRWKNLRYIYQLWILCVIPVGYDSNIVKARYPLVHIKICVGIMDIHPPTGSDTSLYMVFGALVAESGIVPRCSNWTHGGSRSLKMMDTQSYGDCLLWKVIPIQTMGFVPFFSDNLIQSVWTTSGQAASRMNKTGSDALAKAAKAAPWPRFGDEVGQVLAPSGKSDVLAVPQWRSLLSISTLTSRRRDEIGSSWTRWCKIIYIYYKLHTWDLSQYHLWESWVRIPKKKQMVPTTWEQSLGQSLGVIHMLCQATLTLLPSTERNLRRTLYKELRYSHRPLEQT